MKNSTSQPDLFRRCRAVGLCGTLAGHGAVLLLLWLAMQSASSMELPSPVESTVIALHVVTAQAAPQAPLESASPPPPAEPEPEPEKKALQAKESTPPPPKPKQQPKPRKPTPQKREPKLHAVAPSPSATETKLAAQAVAAAQAAAVAQAKQTLLSYLMAQIERHKRYPHAARKLGLEGVVHIAVLIDAGGNLASIRIEKTDAHQVLQKAATETMRKVQEGWKPQATPQAVSVVIPLRYSLVGG